MGEERKWWTLTKYFIHGLGFSIIYLVLAIGWAFILVLLVGLGFIIGLIIGLGLLFLIVGYVNSFITDLLWFPVRTSFWSTMFHGFALFIVLLIVGVIFVWIPNTAFPTIYTQVITFIGETFLNGLAGKTIAGGWKEETGASMEMRVEEATLDLQKLDVQKLYDKILLDYVIRYGSMTGKAMLNDNINDYLKKGLSSEEAVLRLAKAGGYVN